MLVRTKTSLYLLPALILILVVFGAACTAAAPATEEEETVTEAEPEAVEQEKEEAETEAETAEEIEAGDVDPTGCNIEPPAEPTTINVFGWAFDMMEFYADEFKKCDEVENIEVNVQLLDFISVQEAVRLALSSGGESPYDIVHGSNPEVAEWGSQGWLLPLNDFIDKYRDEYDLDDIPEAAWEGGTVNGNIYGVPAVANTLHLMYRADLFEKYNLEPPATYDEVITACEVLKDEPSIDIPFTMNLHAGWAWEFEFWNFMRSLGGNYLNEDNTPAFNSPEGVAAATKMKEVVDACMGEEGLGYSIEASEIGLQTGQLAFVNIWAASGPGMYDPDRSDFADVIEFAPAAAPEPGAPHAGSAWNDYYTIPATSAVDPDLAFRMIMEAVDLESQRAGAAVGIPTRESITEGVRNLEEARETFNNGSGIYPPNPAITLAQSALWNWLPFIGTGEMTPQEALDAAAEEYIKEATAQGFLN